LVLAVLVLAVLVLNVLVLNILRVFLLVGSLVLRVSVKQVLARSLRGDTLWQVSGALHHGARPRPADSALSRAGESLLRTARLRKQLCFL
jgi:hypothetical protein